MRRPQVLGIFRAQLQFRKCTDLRPWIVIDVRGEKEAVVLPISAQMDLYEGPGHHFLLDAAHPNFLETGLRRTCYIDDRFPVVVLMDQLVEYRGRLVGELATSFERWGGWT